MDVSLRSVRLNRAAAGPDYPQKETVLLYHASVLQNIDALGKATQRLADRPHQLVAALDAELNRVHAEYSAWQRQQAADGPAHQQREARRLAEAQEELEALRSELRRAELARDAARAELRVVEERGAALSRELRLERAELRKLRLELALLAPPLAYTPPRAPAQPEYAELRAPRRPPLCARTADAACQTFAPWDERGRACEAAEARARPHTAAARGAEGGGGVRGVRSASARRAPAREGGGGARAGAWRAALA
ncbi:hypothetical protein AB1Y20_002351 [Prymnesium parvum]|uniref:Uncharacterized protein n=1 Tax=Prymnesium parvum TaxID=97485 RepID=A0AB34JAF4_PRYPA